MQQAVSFGWVIIAGALQAASIAAPWGDNSPSGSLQLIAMALFVWQLDSKQHARDGALLGWVFATVWLACTFWWLFVAMHTYGGLASWIAALAVVALAGLLAIYYAAGSAIFVAVSPQNQYAASLLFGALWMLAELARGVWFTGFGWGAIGYAHVNLLAGAAAYVGAYGIAGLVAGIAYLSVAAFRRRATLSAAGYLLAAVAIAAVMAWSPTGFTQSTGQLRVALLQGNIAQDEKFQTGTGVAEALGWYGQELAKGYGGLVVAPETAIPLLPHQLPEAYWTQLQQAIAHNRHAVLLGVPLGSLEAGYTNSVVGMRPADSQVPNAFDYRYDKHHLVPFGEFIPPFFHWFTEMMQIPLGDFSRGAVGQRSFAWQGQHLAPNVCYEDLFGEELGARFRDASQAPTIFVNVSNIGWFGNTVAIDQHLNISRMRVLEFDRPFIRATNTGQTAIIDHSGRVTHVLPRMTRGVLVGEVEGRSGTTPFAWWVSRWGLWPLWLIGVSVVFAAAAMRLRQSRPERDQAAATP